VRGVKLLLDEAHNFALRTYRTRARRCHIVTSSGTSPVILLRTFLILHIFHVPGRVRVFDPNAEEKHKVVFPDHPDR
jgi:hypothetical protein